MSSKGENATSCAPSRTREPLGLHERLDQEAAEELLDRAGVGLDRHERPVAREEPVGRERVDVRVERESRAEGLDRRDEAGRGVLSPRAVAEVAAQSGEGATGEEREEGPLAREEAPKRLRDREDVVPVRDGREDLLEVLREERRALRLARGAEVAGAAGEGEQVLAPALRPLLTFSWVTGGADPA
jgi:hypothetical protein